jgi:UDP-N-acetylglucosamine transferase subunit ALG13
VSTFVSVGNATQPFSRLLDKVAQLAPGLPQPVVVQCGSASFASPCCTVHTFLEMNEFARSIAEAQLLILHAGAGSIIHAVRAGKIPVVMPRQAKYGESIDDHQLELASALARSGKIVVALTPEQLELAVHTALARPATPERGQHEFMMARLVRERLDAYASSER